MKNFYEKLVSGEFALMVKEAVKGEALSSSDQVHNMIFPLTAEEPDVEKFYMLCLDAKNKIISLETVSSGSLSSSAVYPREVIKKALVNKTAAVIFAHNHPSGDPEPSSDDDVMTARLYMACAIMGITVHDHIVVGSKERHYSYANAGKIANYQRSTAAFFMHKAA